MKAPGSKAATKKSGIALTFVKKLHAISHAIIIDLFEEEEGYMTLTKFIIELFVDV